MAIVIEKCKLTDYPGRPDMYVSDIWRWLSLPPNVHHKLHISNFKFTWMKIAENYSLFATMMNMNELVLFPRCSGSNLKLTIVNRSKVRRKGSLEQYMKSRYKDFSWLCLTWLMVDGRALNNQHYYNHNSCIVSSA